jgi:hypothetical protein
MPAYRYWQAGRNIVNDPVIDPDDIEYYRDANDVHHVPNAV